MKKENIRRPNRTTRFWFLFVFVLVYSTSSFAQQPDRGFKTANSYAASGLETINTTNGNLMLNIPIASLPVGRGGNPGFTVSLQYNSKLWESRQATSDLGNPDENGNTHFASTSLALSERGGWKLATRYELRVIDRWIFDNPDPCWLNDPIEHKTYRWKIEMDTPDGGTKQFVPTLMPVSGAAMDIDGYSSVDRNGNNFIWMKTTINGVCTLSSSDTNLTDSGVTYISLDGSRLRLVIPEGSDNWKLYYPNGTVVENIPNVTGVAQRITDRNDNYIDIKTDGSIIDQLGRSITITADGNGDTTVSSKGVAGETVSTFIDWDEAWVRKTYTLTTALNAPSVFQTTTTTWNIPPVVKKITFPAQLGEQEMLFEYLADDEQPGSGDQSDGWGEIKKITLPTGAKSYYDYGIDGDTAQGVLDRFAYSKHLEYNETYDGVTVEKDYFWKYNVAKWAGGVISPSGETSGENLIYYPSGPQAWDSGLAYRSGSPGAVVERMWAQNLPVTISSSGPYYWSSFQGTGSANAYVKTELTTLPDSNGAVSSSSKTAVKDFKYDKNGNVLEIKEYDFVTYGSITRSGGKVTGLPSLTLARKTVNTYYYQAADADNATANSYSYSNTTAPKLLNLIKSSEVQNASGTLFSRVEYFYDGGTSTPDKGNLTETRTWDSQETYSNPLTTGNSISTLASYDSYGNVIETTDPKGVETTLTYGNISGPNGNVSGLYPTTTEVASNYSTLKRTSTSTYDFYTGLVTSTTDVDNGLTNATVYDDLGRPEKVITAQGTALESWTTTDHNAEELRVIVKSDVAVKGDGKKVAIQHFDELGRVRLTRTLENPDSESATNEQHGIKVQARYGYNDPSPTEPDDPEDSLGSYTLTSNPYRATSSSGATGEATMGWTLTYAPKDGMSSSATTYIGTGLPAAFGGSNTSTTGTVTTARDSERTLVTDQAGKNRISKTNALGQLKEVWEILAASETGSESISFPGTTIAHGFKTSYSYDTLGKMVHVQQGVQNRYFMYSSIGRLLRVKQPEQDVNTSLNTSGNPGNNSWTAGFTYDDNGNVLTATDAKNTVITNTYDALNRPLTRSYSDGTPTVTNYYDGTGLPSVPAFSKGKLTRVSSSVSDSRYTDFDPLGRLEQFQQITDGQTYTSSYEYNLSGALTKETYPSGRVVQNEFDASGDLSKIYGRATTTAIERIYASNFFYSVDGKIEKLKLGSGVWESAKFNSRLQVTELSVGWGPTSGSLWKMQTEYGELQTNGTVDATKNSGSIGKHTVSFTGLANPFVQNFKYDSLYRLTEAKETNNSNQTWKQNFTYDRYGNRLTHQKYIGTIEATQTDETNPEIDDATNRFESTEGYTFDANGNVIVDFTGRQFTFNGDNKQTEVKTAANKLVGKYFYDGEGKRVKKLTYDQHGVEKDVTVFVYSGRKLIAEYTTEAPPEAPTTRFTVTDGLGSPRVILDSAGDVVSRRDFLPFGEEIDPDGTYRKTADKYGQTDHVRQKFTGYEHDEETGLDFAEARMYENRHGRFTAVDPLLASGKSADPQTFNRYVYVMNNPLVMTDPTGLQAGTHYKDLGDGRWALANYAKKGYTKYEGRARVGTAPDGTRLRITSRGWRPIDDVVAAQASRPRAQPAASSDGPINTPLVNDLGARAPALLNVTTGLAVLMASPALGPLLPTAASGVGATVSAATSSPISITGPLTAVGTFGIGTGATELADNDTDNSNESSTTLHRGVTVGHPGYENALQGIAIPIGGPATPAQHNEDDTRSIYTSWTTSQATAVMWATASGNGGVVMTANIPASRQVVSPDRFQENEVLVTGTVTGAEVRRIPR